MDKRKSPDKYPKPHKSRREYGLTIVEQMVAPSIRALLDVMHQQPESYVLVKIGVVIAPRPKAWLVMPGQPNMVVAPDMVEPLLEWLNQEDLDVNGFKRYRLLPETMQHIKEMEQK